MLSSTIRDQRANLAPGFSRACQKFARQFQALFEAFGDGVSWRVMPKMHLFLELCSEGTEPQKFWCYRDEDFGGPVARQSKMKGMWRKLLSYSAYALDLFRIKNPVPRLVAP